MQEWVVKRNSDMEQTITAHIDNSLTISNTHYQHKKLDKITREGVLP